MVDNFWDFPPSEPDHQESHPPRPALLLGIVEAFRALEYAMDARATGAYLTAVQARAACELSGAPQGIPLTELKDRLRMSKQATGQLVSRMSQRGLIEHREHPHDSRCTLVRLTTTGQDQWELVNRSLMGIERQLVIELGTNNAARLAGMLPVIRDLDERAWQ